MRKDIVTLAEHRNAQLANLRENIVTLAEDNRALLNRVMDAPDPEPVTVRDVLVQHKECCVCNELRRVTVMLPCLHTCCSSCVNKWSLTGPELTCPVCRAAVQFTHNTKDGMTVQWTRGQKRASYRLVQ